MHSPEKKERHILQWQGMRDAQPRKNRRVTACDGKVMRDAQPMKNERVMPFDGEATGDAQPRENKRAKHQERLQPAGQQFTISFVRDDSS